MPLSWPYHRPVAYVTIGMCQSSDISLNFNSQQKGEECRNVFDFSVLTSLKVICSCSFPDIFVLLKRAFHIHFRIPLLLELNVGGVVQIN